MLFKIINLLLLRLYRFNGLIVIFPKAYKGTIIERGVSEVISIAISNEIPVRIVSRPYFLPLAKNYFFCHHAIFNSLSKNYFNFNADTSVIWMTHEEQRTRLSPLALKFLSNAKNIVCMQPKDQALMKERINYNDSSSRDFVSFKIGGYDQNIYKKSKFSFSSPNVNVCLVSSWRPRKNSQTLLPLVLSSPDINFRVYGNTWEYCDEFNELSRLPNFSYLKVENLADLRAYYLENDIFLSLSTVEGGPIPLLEAAALGLVPVATKTGFAPNIIEHGKNGYLIDDPFDIVEIKSCLNRAISSRGTLNYIDVTDYSWDSWASFMFNKIHE